MKNRVTSLGLLIKSMGLDVFGNATVLERKIVATVEKKFADDFKIK